MALSFKPPEDPTKTGCAWYAEKGDDLKAWIIWYKDHLPDWNGHVWKLGYRVIVRRCVDDIDYTMEHRHSHPTNETTYSYCRSLEEAMDLADKWAGSLAMIT